MKTLNTSRPLQDIVDDISNWNQTNLETQMRKWCDELIAAAQQPLTPLTPHNTIVPCSNSLNTIVPLVGFRLIYEFGPKRDIPL